MRLQTSVIIRQPAEKIWPLLCSSKMDGALCCPFRLGVPKPVECRLPAGQGGVGAERQCISTQGVIRQRITEWSPPNRLRFEMEDTNLYFRPCVSAIVEEFTLTEINGGTRLTRTTRVTVTGRMIPIKSLALGIGLKFVHLYVFRNWRRLSAGV